MIQPQFDKAMLAFGWRPTSITELDNDGVVIFDYVRAEYEKCKLYVHKSDFTLHIRPEEISELDPSDFEILLELKTWSYIQTRPFLGVYKSDRKKTHAGEFLFILCDKFTRDLQINHLTKKDYYSLISDKNRFKFHWRQFKFEKRHYLTFFKPKPTDYLDI